MASALLRNNCEMNKVFNFLRHKTHFSHLTIERQATDRNADRAFRELSMQGKGGCKPASQVDAQILDNHWPKQLWGTLAV